LPKTKEMATSCFLGQHEKECTAVIIQKRREILETDWGMASVFPP